MKWRSPHPSWYWLRFAYALLFAAILIATYAKELPSFLGRIPHHDLIGHVMLYGIGGYVGDRLFHHRRWRLWGWRWSLWGWVFSAGTIVEECLQALSPHRTFSRADMVASLLGIACGGWLANRHRRAEV